jgi:uncharacterized membrane protein
VINKQIQNLINVQIKTLPIRLFLLAGLTALALVLVVQSSDFQVAYAQDQPDSVLGKVTNGTGGGELPGDLEVLLMSIDLANNRIIEQESTTVDEDGIFEFSNLISGPDLSYRIVVNHGSYTPSVDLSTIENWQNVSMSIYNETKSLEDITIGSYVMMIPNIDARSRQVGVLTVINVENRGDRVWVPDLTDPQLTGLDLLRFIPPGEFAILVSYILGYEGDSFDFNLKLPYGADKVRMLLPEDGGSIDAEGFGSPDVVVVADSVFNQYQGNNYAAGVELGATFSGLPQPTIFQAISDFFSGRTYLIIIIWIVGIAFLAILGYAIYSTRKGSKLSNEDDDELANRDDIIAEIVALDEEYEADNIDEDEYSDRRCELKRLAIELNVFNGKDIAAEDDIADIIAEIVTIDEEYEADTPETSDINSTSRETTPEDSDK